MDSNVKADLLTTSEVSASTKKTLRVDEIYSRKDRQVHYVKSSKSTKADRFTRFILVVRRIINTEGNVSATAVDIKSPLLADCLRNIYAGSRLPGLNKSPPSFTPEVLYHAVPHLKARRKEEEAKDSPNAKLLSDIDEAINFVTEDYGSDEETINSLHKNAQITFDLLWTLFPPDSTIVRRSDTTKELQAFKFSHGTYKEDWESVFYEIQARQVRHDGEDFGWGDHTFKILQFQDAKSIDSLEAFPLVHHKDRKQVEEDFLLNGKTFPALLKPTLQNYEGMAIEFVFEFDQWVEKRFHVSGRVMIDPVAFKLHVPNSHLLRPWVHSKFEPKDLKHRDSLFCTHRVLGYSFEERKWGSFAVSGLKDVTWDERAIDKLMLDERKRTLITALVLNHQSDDGDFDDVVAGKGKGLVGLLSGPPGVGKTLTAEVVAELSKRPLYVVTAGELGAYGWQIDMNLNKILSVAFRWGCVLLIDEADIFLRKRADGQPEHNALVSIFLRRLEYFRGIIILTTNRREDIDEAFKSRIHFKFDYPPLDEETRLDIWYNFLSDKLECGDAQQQRESLRELAQMPLNGREIKNAVSCALSVSKSTKDDLTAAFIKDIVENIMGSWD